MFLQLKRCSETLGSRARSKMRGKYFGNVTYRKAKGQNSHCPLNHWLVILLRSSRLNMVSHSKNLCCCKQLQECVHKRKWQSIGRLKPKV